MRRTIIQRLTPAPAAIMTAFAFTLVACGANQAQSDSTPVEAPTEQTATSTAPTDHSESSVNITFSTDEESLEDAAGRFTQCSTQAGRLLQEAIVIGDSTEQLRDQWNNDVMELEQWMTDRRFDEAANRLCAMADTLDRDLHG